MKIAISTPFGWQGVMMSARMVMDLLVRMGHEVRLFDLEDNPAERFDLVVLYERFLPHWLDKGKKTVLIPNQEAFAPGLIPMLSGVDRVLAKTRHAKQIFKGLGVPTCRVGFYSPDRSLAHVRKDYEKWIHIAGSSPFKGTKEIVRTWEKNPDFPCLTVVLRIPGWHYPDRPNLKFLYDQIPDVELRKLQNEYGVHLCLSTAEGWNHTMVEAMGTEGLVIATDAPPMNEHVTAERGVLCRSLVKMSMYCDFMNFVTEEDLAEVVRRVRAMPEEEKRRKGENARRYFLSLEAGFKAAFQTQVEELLREEEQPRGIAEAPARPLNPQKGSFHSRYYINPWGITFGK